jgi:hypothetical protein
VVEGSGWAGHRVREPAGGAERRATVPATVDMWGRRETGGCQADPVVLVVMGCRGPAALGLAW